MKPAVGQICSLHAPFEKDVEDFSAAACDVMEIWLPKLETYLETHTVEDALKLLADHGMAAPVASFQGGLLATQGAARDEHWRLFGKRLELCAAMGIGVLVVACDVHGPLSETDLERVQMSLVHAAEHAGQAGVKLALELQATASLGNNLQTIAMLVAEAAHPNLGICLDVFQYYLGPSKYEDLGLVAKETLFHVQFADLTGRPREFASDSDRILPGDGDFLFGPIVDRLKDIGYEGCISLELMNPLIWQIAPRSTAEIGLTALRRVLGQASMG